MPGPRVETRGYFLASLTGLTLRTADLRAELNPRAILGRPFGAARTGGQRRRIRDCPSASPCRGSPPWLPIRFERGHVVAPGTNSVPKGLTLGAPLISGPNPGLFSVAPLGLQEQARVAGDGFFPPLLSPAGGGGRRRRPGVDLNPAILGKGCRFVQPHSGLGRWGCPESRVHRLRGRPPVRPGTRCRAGDGAWNMSPFLSGVEPAPPPVICPCHSPL